MTSFLERKTTQITLQIHLRDIGQKPVGSIFMPRLSSPSLKFLYNLRYPPMSLYVMTVDYFFSS